MEEIARHLFITLNRDTHTMCGGLYYILNDGEYMDEFFALSDNDAKIQFDTFCSKQ